MAVKTRFLMAEAMFEMAKHHRKLKKMELATAEIAKGKRILEEAMRDYPGTKHVVQGEYLLANLAQEIERLKTAEIWIAGLEDVSGAQLYTEVSLTVPLGIVVGSESDGLRRLVRDRCDWLMRMPMRGHINSLNAAIAGSIALYEVLRQRMVQ